MAERYMTKDQARVFMAAELGVVLNERQMRRAVEHRKLPFFPDPVTGGLVITESMIRETYARAAAGQPKPAPHPAPQNPKGVVRGAARKSKGAQGVRAGKATFRARHRTVAEGPNQ